MFIGAFEPFKLLCYDWTRTTPKGGCWVLLDTCLYRPRPWSMSSDLKSRRCQANKHGSHKASWVTLKSCRIRELLNPLLSLPDATTTMMTGGFTICTLCQVCSSQKDLVLSLLCQVRTPCVGLDGSGPCCLPLENPEQNTPPV